MGRRGKLAPFAAVHAECAPTDFAIQDVKAGVTGGHVSVAGRLTNGCAKAAGAELEVVAKDASGTVLQSKRGWAVGTSNIDPNQSVSFDLGRLLRVQPGMETYTVHVVDARTW